MSGDLFGSPAGPPPAGEKGAPRRAPAAASPLADRMRPRDFDELVGMDELFRPGSPLAALREGSHLASMILWGPPGSGKTTLARLIAKRAGVPFVGFTAVLSGVKEVKEVMERAVQHRIEDWLNISG